MVLHWDFKVVLDLYDIALNNPHILAFSLVKLYILLFYLCNSNNEVMLIFLLYAFATFYISFHIFNMLFVMKRVSSC